VRGRNLGLSHIESLHTQGRPGVIAELRHSNRASLRSFVSVKESKPPGMPPKAEIANGTLPIRRANRLGSVVAIKEFPSRNGPRNKRTLTASIKRTLKHQHLLGSWIPNQMSNRK